jgi:hypothetical protein
VETTISSNRVSAGTSTISPWFLVISHLIYPIISQKINIVSIFVWPLIINSASFSFPVISIILFLEIYLCILSSSRYLSKDQEGDCVYSLLLIVLLTLKCSMMIIMTLELIHCQLSHLYYFTNFK